ncbi:head-to-tail stopper [Microbacterium phage Necrophoxinus]|nr:head-to-tail stopper [Microbacterium phage Necrophoxinus]
MVSIGVPVTNWQDQIRAAAVQYMNAEVCFYSVVDGTYDEVTNTGTPGSVEILWRGKARIQHLRTARDASTNVQRDDIRAFRFQLDPEDNPPPLFSGTKARVIDGGRDSQLELYAYSVDSAVNSSHMAVRTVELTANMRAANWSWEVPVG